MNDAAVNGTVIRVADIPGHDFICVHVVGDVELVAEAIFSTALDQLAGMRCATVCVDLGEVGFAGTALLTFLVRVINRAPAGTPVLLCRPDRMTRRLLHLSFLDTIATVRDDLPFRTGIGVADRDAGPMGSAPIRPQSRRLTGAADRR